MDRRIWTILTLGIVAIGFLASESSARAQNFQPYPQSQDYNRLYYYPYYYFPHNYWPAQGPRWPEGPGMPYMRPPAYQALPAFREPGWRYEMWQSQRYYRGNHFWLDVF
ncbi:MAG: hypothetical protein HYX68_21600 [Planctomycetes bacterium]|nr:hypothetical protein [Planctomycetota bacterium]